MKKYLIVFSLVFLFISCDKKQVQNMSSNKDTLVSDSSSSNLNTKFIGIYKGQISCDDCESVELTLKDNNNYILILHLSAEEKTADSIVKKEGKYSWNKENSTLSLDKYDLSFRVVENKLYYLDHSSKIDEHEVLIKE